jgi:hypothetical protein
MWEAGSDSASNSEPDPDANFRNCGAQNESKKGHGRSQSRPGGCRQVVVADSHHFDEEQDQDADPHQSEKRDPDPQDPQHFKCRPKGACL